jgi:hypothetical protein
MARISYVDPDDVTDPEMRQWLEEAIRDGRPGPENQSIRAHHPAVMRSFSLTRRWMAQDGLLEKELRELVRVRIATSMNCSY